MTRLFVQAILLKIGTVGIKNLIGNNTIDLIENYSDIINLRIMT